jgi:uncharacterized membrane-anchored protein
MVYLVLLMPKKRNDGSNVNYSISNKLRKDGKSSEEFEIILNRLSLEEVVGLKLELSSKYGLNGKMYGTPIWSSLKNIIKDAVLKYAVSATRSKREAARFLGIQESSLHILIKKYNVDNYFRE